MPATATLEEIELLVARLAPEDQASLAERILKRISGQAGPPKSAPPDWMSLRGIAPNMLDGEDAQAWVSRTRQESDDREEILRQRP